jgi:hypothetical protein
VQRRSQGWAKAIEDLLLLRRQHGTHLRPSGVGYSAQARQELIEDGIGSRTVSLQDLVDLPLLSLGQL